MRGEAAVIGKIVSAFLEAGWKPGPSSNNLRADLDRIRAAFEHTLTAREIEVLSLYAHGGNERTIADDLSLSQATVHSHAREIRRRLGVRTVTHAAALAVAAGLIEMGET